MLVILHGDVIPVLPSFLPPSTFRFTCLCECYVAIFNLRCLCLALKFNLAQKLFFLEVKEKGMKVEANLGFYSKLLVRKNRNKELKARRQR